MTLDQLLTNLQKLKNQGYQDIKIFAVHGASGEISEIGTPSIQVLDESEEEDDEFGFVLRDAGLDSGEEWVQLYIGN